mgnify:CR=1 FL=1
MSRVESGRSLTRIAVVGAGSIGREHVRRIVGSSSCELASITDSTESTAALADDLGVTHYASLAELLANDRPDGVVIATPNQLHVEHATACIEAGLPILLEKPVADSAARAEQLLAVAEAAGAVVLTGHHRTHSPHVRVAVEAVRSGLLGQVVGVTGTALFCKPDDYFAQAWRREPGGGPILLNLIHEVHSLRMLCGEIVAVEAVTANQARGFAVEDTAAIILVFASGALGTFLLSDSAGSGRSWEQTSGENPHYASYPDEDCYHVAGTLGSLSVPTMRVSRIADPVARSWFEPMERSTLEVVPADPLALQLEHFGAVVRGEVEPLCTLRDGVMNVRIVEAIHESAATGRRIELGLVP